MMHGQSAEAGAKSGWEPMELGGQDFNSSNQGIEKVLPGGEKFPNGVKLACAKYVTGARKGDSTVFITLSDGDRAKRFKLSDHKTFDRVVEKANEYLEENKVATISSDDQDELRKFFPKGVYKAPGKPKEEVDATTTQHQGLLSKFRRLFNR